jgi:hypothetical protein
LVHRREDGLQIEPRGNKGCWENWGRDSKGKRKSKQKSQEERGENDETATGELLTPPQVESLNEESAKADLGRSYRTGQTPRREEQETNTNGHPIGDVNGNTDTNPTDTPK